MANTVHALDFLAKPDTSQATGVCALFGDEPFLRRLVRRELIRAVLGETGDDVPYQTFVGKEAQWRDVADELTTVSLFGDGARLVVVEQADPFVSAYRDRLEDFAAKPPSTGVLILEIDTHAANTRLYKQLDKTGFQVECRAPQRKRGKSKSLDEGRVLKWINHWANQAHGVKLDSAAAELLLELVGPEFGLLDSELSKLSLYVEPGGKVTAELARDVVGGWRTKTAWEIVDAAADGDAAQALALLDRLLESGETAHALLGQIAWSLRRFAAATRIYQSAETEGRRPALSEALKQAGFHTWGGKLKQAESQLKQLGRARAGKLYQWLLESDLALKGSHSHPDRARLVLERLIVRLARQTRDLVEV